MCGLCGYELEAFDGGEWCDVVDCWVLMAEVELWSDGGNGRKGRGDRI